MIAKRIETVRAYLTHPLWPRGMHAAPGHHGGTRDVPAWLQPGLSREWARARDFSEWVELAVGLHVLRSGSDQTVPHGASNASAGGAHGSPPDALVRWDRLHGQYAAAVALHELRWVDRASTRARDENPLMLLPRVELHGWAWSQGRAIDREERHRNAMHKRQRSLATRALTAWAGNALPGPRPGGPQGPVFPVLAWHLADAAHRAEEAGRPLMARLSFARLGAARAGKIE